jgi:hypothetical protein
MTMLHSSWLRQLTSPRRRFPAPRLEQLEDRCVLATIVGVTSAGALVRFGSTTPGTLTNIAAITGLGAGQSVVGIDFRPQTGELYAMGFLNGLGQLYKVNPTNAAATAVGNPFSTRLTGTQFGFDFDPVADKARIVSNTGENLRVDPTSGSLTSRDSAINPADTVVGIAYDHNFKGAATTTLFGYDSTTNRIVTIGSPGGSPVSPNTGTLSNVGGASGVTAQQPANLGFDIDADGTAYLNLVVGGTSGLYTANLSTGAVTLVGAFGTVMSHITVAPAASFSVTGFPTPRTVSLTSTITVTARDVYGLTATSYSGTVHFTSSDPAARLPFDAPLARGTGTFSVAFNTPGTQSVTATDTALSTVAGSQTNITVLPNSEVVGVTSAGRLVRFNTASPGSVTDIAAVTGLTVGQSLVGLDFRPATAELYGMGYASGTGQLYKIDPTTAVATAVGAPFSTTLNGFTFGFDFDPVRDLVRITSDANENLRVSPVTGALISNDPILTPTTANVVGIAYDRNFAGATVTTLYGYDTTTNRLVTVGSVNGSPASPNAGVVMTVGASGFTVTAGSEGNLGFDIDANGGAYLNLVVGGTSGLYTANLSTGALTLNGTFPAGITLSHLSVAPATAFRVAGFPSPTTTNTAGTFTVTAVDAFGTTVPGYRGTVTFTSSDPAATLPVKSTLTNGTGTFTASFATAGTQSLTASDAIVPAITGSQTGIIVGTVPPPPPGIADRIGVVRGSPDRVATLSLDTNGDGVFDSGDSVFTFGLSSDKFLVGDWVGLGFDSVGVVRPTSSGVAQFSLDSNGDNVFDAGDSVFFFGLNTDTFLTGDWNGSHTTKIGVVRPGANGVPVFSLDTNGDGVFDAGDQVFSFGLNGDTFVTGDWNGDGRAKIGVVRRTSSGVLQWVLDTNGDGVFDAGDSVFFFGLNGDTPLVGDWTGSGTAKIGVARGQADGTAIFALDMNGDGVFDAGDSVFNFGLATDRFLVGKWRLPGQLVAADGALTAALPPLALNANFVAVMNQAIAAWQQAGLDPQSVARLWRVTYAVAPLGGAALGESLGDRITLDATAAGHGWSEWPTPEAGKMDLFTVLSHELGHSLGLEHSAQQDDVMFESLLPGVRKAPTTADVDALFASVGRW